MTLEQTEKIDLVADSPEGEKVLVMVALEDWSENETMLRDLSDKIHTYATYVNSPAYKKQCGDKLTKIMLSTSHKPTAEVERMVEKASISIKIPIEIKVLPF